jgi:hypothetical protein
VRKGTPPYKIFLTRGSKGSPLCGSSVWLVLDLSKTVDIIIRLRPIRRIIPLSDGSHERGMRPIGRSRDKLVFDRVEMDIVEMPGKIVGITYCVFPKTALPNPALALGGAGG